MRFRRTCSSVFILLILLSLLSCRSNLIGAGLSVNHGNLLREGDNQFQNTRGGFIEYRWKTVNGGLHNFGIDHSLNYRGYLGNQSDEHVDILMYSFTGKYYYNILNLGQDNLNIDIAFGIGYSQFVLVRLPDVAIVNSNISAEFRFPESQMFYITPRLNYNINIPDKTYNAGFELGFGVRIKR